MTMSTITKTLILVVQVLLFATVCIGNAASFEELPLSVPPDQSSCDPAFTARIDVDSSVTLQGSTVAQAFNYPATNVCVIITGAPTIDVTTTPLTGALLFTSLFSFDSNTNHIFLFVPPPTQYRPGSPSSPTVLCFSLPIPLKQCFLSVEKIH